jgi:hypothetical protein
MLSGQTEDDEWDSTGEAAMLYEHMCFACRGWVRTIKGESLFWYQVVFEKCQPSFDERKLCITETITQELLSGHLGDAAVSAEPQKGPLRLMSIIWR